MGCVGGVACASVAALNMAVAYQIRVGRGAGDVAAAPSVASQQAGHTCFQTAVGAAGTYQARQMTGARHTVQQAANAALRVDARIAAAVPFWAKVASRVAGLQVAVVLSFWANYASWVAAVTLVWIVSCDAPAAR